MDPNLFGTTQLASAVGIQGSGLRVARFRVQGSGFGVRGSGFGVRGSGFGVYRVWA